MTVVIVADDSIWQEPPMFKNKKSWLKNGAKKKEERPMKKQTKRNTMNLGIFSYTYTRGRHSF